MNTNEPQNDRSLDVLGIKPVGEAILKLTDASVSGASAFLSRICLPAAEEYGLLLRDRVRAWRAANLTAILKKAEQKLETEGAEDVVAHPKIVSTILEQGSWIDDSEVQDMWAGLLSTSCCEDGGDDSNLIFVNLLTQLSSLQARILNHACDKAPKSMAPNGLVIPTGSLDMPFDELCKLACESDVHRIDREIDHLTALGLFSILGSGFRPDAQHLIAKLSPSPLALQLYVRSQGSRLSPDKFYDLKLPELPVKTASNAE